MLKNRILVMAHAHPDFSLGGGEIAAYNLFKAYKNNPEVEDAWFLARADRGQGPTGTISKRRDHEYLWEQAVHDWHRMSAVHLDSVLTWFADLIRALRPTAVHSHHYAHLGLEYLRIIKQVDPKIKVILTLHEYMAICANNGQMIKTGSFNLCSRASADECHQCFPNKSVEDFWLRKHRFMRYFDLIDQFVSPSKFLRNRYIEWGLPAEKIVVIENGQSDEPPLKPRAINKNETRNRFGFFGQINPFKGLDVLLEGLHLITQEDRKKIVLEVHGANLEVQPKQFQEKIESLCRPLIDEGVVQWVGPYQPHDLRNRMENIDWVCVPSIWWENSPMVIQEAFVYRRPLLVSNIGGMAEKVENAVNGIHVAAGNPSAWASVLLKCVKYPNSIWKESLLHIPMPNTYDSCAQSHLSIIKAQEIL